MSTNGNSIRPLKSDLRQAAKEELFNDMVAEANELRYEGEKEVEDLYDAKTTGGSKKVTGQMVFKGKP